MSDNEAPTRDANDTVTASATDEFTFSDSVKAFVTHDPTLRVGQLKAAQKKPLSVKPSETVAKAMTLMMSQDFSQLPVMSSTRSVTGIFSWRSLAKKIAFGKTPTRVEDAIEQAVVVDSNHSLFDAARLVADVDCVLIKGEDGTITGILTSYDLTVDFRERSEPFVLLEQIEKHIRNQLDRTISVPDMREVRDSLDKGKEDLKRLRPQLRRLCQNLAKT